MGGDASCDLPRVAPGWGCPGGSGVLFFAPTATSDGRRRVWRKTQQRPDTPTPATGPAADPVTSINRVVTSVRGRGLVTSPIRRRLIARLKPLAPRPLGAGLDLVLCGVAQALLALLVLAAYTLGLGLELLLRALTRLLHSLSFDLLDQLAHPLLGLAAHVLGALHHPLLDLGLEPDGKLVGLLGARLGLSSTLLGSGNAPVGLRLRLFEHLAGSLRGLLFGSLNRPCHRLIGLRLAGSHLRRDRLAVGLGPLHGPLEGLLGSVPTLLCASHASLGSTPLVALGGNPLAAFLTDLAQRGSRPLLDLGAASRGARFCRDNRLLGLGSALLAYPDPLQGLLGDAVHLLRRFTDCRQPHRGFAHPVANYYGRRRPPTSTTSELPQLAESGLSGLLGLARVQFALEDLAGRVAR